MSIVTFVPSPGFTGVHGVINSGSGVPFDVGAALVSGSGVITVDSVASMSLYDALLHYPGVIVQGTTPGPVSNYDTVGPAIAHSLRSGSVVAQAGDVLARNSDGTYSPAVVGGGGSGGNANWRGAWATGTTYNVNDLVEYGDTTWVCSTSHTSASTFDSTKFTELSQFRGAWQALTVYNTNDVVTQSGLLYAANSNFTSGASFNATNWTQLSSSGSSGVTVQGVQGTGLGAAQTIDFSSTAKEIWLVGTLNANLTVTLANRVAGCRARLLLLQDGTGGRTVTISDGTANAVVAISSVSNTYSEVLVDMPDATNINASLSGGGSGGDISAPQTKTSNYSMAAGDGDIKADATSAPLTITLPDATAVPPGTSFSVKRINQGYNSVTVSTVSVSGTYQLIGLQTQVVLDTPGHTLRVESDGTNYIAISERPVTAPSIYRRPFIDRSPYNLSLAEKYPGGVPISANSDNYIFGIANSASNGVPINYLASDTTQFTVPIYKVDANTPRGSVAYSAIYCTASYTSTSQVTGGGTATNIPVPSGVKPSPGSDSEICLIDPGNGDEWNFWGCGVDVSGNWNFTCTNMSYFAGSWAGNGVPAITPSVYASRGPGIPYSACLVRPWEIDEGGQNQGRIRHVCGFAINNPNNSSGHVWPACKSDGTGSTTSINALPQGALIKLRSDFPVADLADPMARVVARAWQEWGVMNVDVTGSPKAYFEDDNSVGLGTLWGGRNAADLMYEIGMEHFLVVDPTGRSSLKEGDIRKLGATQDDPLATLPAQTGTVVLAAGAGYNAGLTVVSPVSLPSWTPAANEPVAVLVSYRGSNGVYTTQSPVGVTGNGLSFVCLERRIERKAYAQNIVHELWAAPGIASPSTGSIAVAFGGSPTALTMRAVRFTAGSTIRRVMSKDFAAVPQGTAITPTNSPSVYLRGTTIASLVVSFGTGRNRTWTAGSGQTAIALNDTQGSGGNQIMQSSFTQAGGYDVLCQPANLSATDEWIYTAFEVT